MEINLKPVIDFGRMPIANGFLTPQEFEKEYFFNMVLGYDPSMKAVGLVHTVEPGKLFHDNYAFFSSTSKGMQEHFKRTANKLLPYARNGLVVEVGSNDGIMLESWKQLNVQAIGVEPSKNVAEISKSLGHEVVSEFINEAIVDKILSRGKVSLVFAANVSSHIKDIEGYFKSITRLIGRHGVFVFEDPYFLDIIQKNAYDQIYDEHAWFFTASFINSVFSALGYNIFDCEHVDVHGGQLRMYVGHKDTYPPGPNVELWLRKENNLEEKLELFKTNIRKSKDKLLDILHHIKKEKKTICGFAATSKATTIFNYCGIGPDIIPFVTDNTPSKQGKYYPGVHIPVVPQSIFEEGKNNPDKKVNFAFLGAWNHFNEIDKFQSWYRKEGGHWITHVPEPRII